MRIVAGLTTGEKVSPQLNRRGPNEPYSARVIHLPVIKLTCGGRRTSSQDRLLTSAAKSSCMAESQFGSLTAMRTERGSGEMSEDAGVVAEENRAQTLSGAEAVLTLAGAHGVEVDFCSIFSSVPIDEQGLEVNLEPFAAAAKPLAERLLVFLER